MDKIEELYTLSLTDPLSTKSVDINEHMPVLKGYAEECSHVTEMGVRWGASTLAFILAKPDKLVSYDIQSTSEIEYIMSHSYSGHTFIIADSLNVEIEQTELLFIDTLHTYNQLILELNRHCTKVDKYIILHDTTTFGLIDEEIYEHASDAIKGVSVEKRGLRTAMMDFLSKNNDWELYKDLTNNNGLSIIKKK